MDDFCQRSWEQDAQLGLALSPLEHQEVPLEEDVLAVPIYLKEPVSRFTTTLSYSTCAF